MNTQPSPAQITQERVSPSGPDVSQIRPRPTDEMFASNGTVRPHYKLLNDWLQGRILPADRWKRLEAGLYQRVRALNAFLGDIYHRQDILKAGRIPAQLVFQNPAYRVEMHGVKLPGEIYIHPELFARQRIAPVEAYPQLLLETLRSVAPEGIPDPTVVLLTPGRTTRRRTRTCRR